MGNSGHIFLMALMTANVLVQGPLVKRVRSRYGKSAGTTVLDGACGIYGLIFIIWASLAWGFLWWGAGIGAGTLMVVVGTWLYRRRAVERLRAPTGS